MVTESQPNPTESRSAFLARLQPMASPEQEFVMFAYDLAKASHRGQLREGGDRYFEHPRSVALILIDECNILDPNVISAALLHDTQEDSSIFGSYTGKSYYDWNQIAKDRISRIFNDDVADIVSSLTKPPHEIPDIGTKERALEIYYENLENCSKNALLVKMADRLHNLRTLKDTSDEKQERKIKETEDHYMPIFRRLSSVDSSAKLLLDKINTTIDLLTVK